jgi:hypothetical protein
MTQYVYVPEWRRLKPNEAAAVRASETKSASATDPGGFAKLVELASQI